MTNKPTAGDNAEPLEIEALHFFDMDRTDLLSWLTYYMGPFGGLDALRAGCPECDGPALWPVNRLAWYAYLIVGVYALAYAAGSYPVITSAYRCGPCNKRRDGAARSRHLATTEGGAPYVAIDIQWPSGKIDEIIRNIGDVPTFIRQYTGLDIGVGVIAYRGRRRLHLDFRERDYVDDQT